MIAVLNLVMALGALGALVSLVAVLKPLPILRLSTRGHAGLALLTCVMLTIGASGIISVLRRAPAARETQVPVQAQEPTEEDRAGQAQTALAECLANPACTAEERATRQAASDEAAEAADRAAAPKVAPGDPQTQAEEAALIGLQDAGLIRSIEGRTVLVDRFLWEQTEIGNKRLLVQLASNRRQRREGLPQVSIQDSRSGRELASFGAFGGVTIH